LLVFSLIFDFYLSKKVQIIEKQLEKRPAPVKKSLAKNQPVTVPEVLYNIAGTIKDKTNRVLILEAFIPTKTVGGKPVQKKERREVIVTSGTKIVKLSFVESENKKRIQLKEQPLTFADLKIGDYVEAIANYNIKNQRRFEASQIRVLPRK